MNEKETHQKIAKKLFLAEQHLEPIASLALEYPKFTEEDAYQIQYYNVDQQLLEGKRLVGYKIGLTSKAAQDHFGISQPDFGHLFDSMSIWNENSIDLSTLIQPKIEGEIAFVLKKDLSGPGICASDVLAAIDFAVPALEIIDSRFQGWKISAVDTIADNGSSALFVLGNKKTTLTGLDLSHLGMALLQNGEIVTTGAGAAIQGGPLYAIAFLANELGKKGISLHEGQVILSGALSGMIDCKEKDIFECQTSCLGNVSVRFSDSRDSL